MKNVLLGLALLAAAPASAAPWERLEGQHSRVRSFHTEVVKDEASWKALWERHAPGQEVPAVSFDTEQVAAVFLGQTLTAGVKVDVKVSADPLDASRLVVYYKPVQRAPSNFAATVVTHPFAIVKTPRAAAVVFEADVRFSNPQAPQAPLNMPDPRRMKSLLEKVSLPSFDGR